VGSEEVDNKVVDNKVVYNKKAGSKKVGGLSTDFVLSLLLLSIKSYKKRFSV